MNIGMILDKPFPPDPRVENQAQTLLKAGHRVFLYSFRYSRKDPESELIYGIELRRNYCPRLFYKLSALAYTVPFYHWYFRKSISAFLKDNNIQAIHIHDMQIARAVFRVNRNLKLPVVLDLHENRPEIMKYYTHVNTFPGKLLIHPSRWKKFEYKYIRKAGKVIVVTEEAKHYYHEEIGLPLEKFCTVPNSVRPSFYQNYHEENSITTRYRDRFMILYIGDTGRRRGLEFVIDSLPELIPEIPEIKLVIVGNSITDHILEKKVEELKLSDYVDLMGWQDFHLFQSYILACHIGICPIHRNLHHDTTFANKLFQYLSFGKPIVVSDCTSQKNLVLKYNCGMVFKDRNRTEFLESIHTLHKDKEFYERLSSNAGNSIRKELNWDITSRELTALYEGL